MTSATAQLLLEHFDSLLATPDSIEQLNQAILQLAVQGKLVPQNPNDESASELVRRIQDKKMQLVEEGEISKSDRLPPIRETDKLFELPTGWMWVRIGEVCAIRGGKRIPKGYSLFDTPTEHIYIRVTDMKKGTISDQNLKYISDVVFKQIRRYIITKDDLYITIAGTIGTVGSVPDKFDRMNLTENAARITPYDLDKSYLQLSLTSRLLQVQLQRKVNQMAQPKLALSRIKTTILPLPPLAEQRRIVARVDQLLAQTQQLAEKIARAQTELTRLNQSTLTNLLAAETPEDFEQQWEFIAEHFDTLLTEPEHVALLRQAILELAVRGKLTRREATDEPAGELLKRIQVEKAKLVEEGKIRKSEPLPPIQVDEKPFDLPEGWEWVRLDLIADIGTGSTPSRSNAGYYENGTIPWVTSSATNQHFIYQADTLITEEAVRDTRLRIYPKHSLIVALYGQGKTRGQVSELLIDATINQACASLVFAGEAKNLRDYAKLYLLKNYQDLRELAAGGAQPNLNLNKVKQVVLPLPPLAEQRRIVAQVEQLLGLCDQLAAKLDAARVERERLVQAVVAGVGSASATPE